MNKRSLIFTIAGLACLLAAGCAHRDKKQDKIIYVYVQAPNCYAPHDQDPPVPPNLDTKSLPVPPPPVAPSSVAPGDPPPPEVEVIPVRPNSAFVWVPGVVDLEWRVDMAAWLLGPAPGARSSLDRRTMGTVAWAVCVASRPLALTDVHRKRVWTRLTPIGVGRWPGTRSWEQCGSGSQRSA